MRDFFSELLGLPDKSRTLFLDVICRVREICKIFYLSDKFLEIVIKETSSMVADHCKSDRYGSEFLIVN